MIVLSNGPSEGARNLANALGAKRRRIDIARRPPTRARLVINWGCGGLPDWCNGLPVLNHPPAVAVAACKLATFRVLAEAKVATVPFTTSLEEAKGWASKSAVVARGLLRGSEGRGIVLSPRGAPVAEAYEGRPIALWTRYIPKDAEYRVHVVGEGAIDVQRKKKRSGMGVDPRIRNYDKGWVFCREDVQQDFEPLNTLAVRAVEALGLDFGAVDVLYNEKKEEFMVLEVNTAPGLEGTTVLKYADALRGAVNG